MVRMLARPMRRGLMMAHDRLSPVIFPGGGFRRR
jgi:hypothetical protein